MTKEKQLAEFLSFFSEEGWSPDDIYTSLKNGEINYSTKRKNRQYQEVVPGLFIASDIFLLSENKGLSYIHYHGYYFDTEDDECHTDFTARLYDEGLSLYSLSEIEDKKFSGVFFDKEKLQWTAEWYNDGEVIYHHI